MLHLTTSEAALVRPEARTRGARGMPARKESGPAAQRRINLDGADTEGSATTAILSRGAPCAICTEATRLFWWPSAHRSPPKGSLAESFVQAVVRQSYGSCTGSRTPDQHHAKRRSQSQPPSVPHRHRGHGAWPTPRHKRGSGRRNAARYVHLLISSFNFCIYLFGVFIYFMDNRNGTLARRALVPTIRAHDLLAASRV